MSTISDTIWQRRGFTLLWGADALAQVAPPEEVVTMREFLNTRQWPERLPSVKGGAMLVVGLEGCLDMLTPADAEEWLKRDLRDHLLKFQGHYNSETALIFWLPDGKQRVRKTPNEEYQWICAPPHSTERISIGRCLWSGAESDAKRIINDQQVPADPDGFAWIGLYHPRIS